MKRSKLQLLILKRRRRERQLPGASPAFRRQLEGEIADIAEAIRRETAPGRRRDDRIVNLWRDFPVPLSPEGRTAAAIRIVRDWEEEVRP